MTHDLIFSLWFFLPAGLANVTPIIVAHVPTLRNMNAPLDMGKKFRGIRIFGDHKTWRGIISGLIIGSLVIWLQSLLYHHSAWARTTSRPIDYTSSYIVVLGLLLSFGALLGDALESFFKRQSKIDSGSTWFPFDQLDYVLGGLLLSLSYVRLPIIYYLYIVIVWFVMHLLFSYIGYLLNLKDKPI